MNATLFSNALPVKARTWSDYKIANQIIVALNKDLNLALTNARQLGVSLPNTATVQELFNTCKARGGAGWDHSALVWALEIMANHQIDEK